LCSHVCEVSERPIGELAMFAAANRAPKASRNSSTVSISKRMPPRPSSALRTNSMPATSVVKPSMTVPAAASSRRRKL